MHAKQSCIRNRFDPANINGKNTLHYFEYIAQNPNEQSEIRKIFEQNQELYIGFIRYVLLQKSNGRVNHKSDIFAI